MDSEGLCAFGIHCPCHGQLTCGCDMKWAHGSPMLDWGIEIAHDGNFKFFVFNTDNNEQFYLCQTHFLTMWSFTVENIDEMYTRWIHGDASLRYKFRLEPEE